MPPAPRDQRVVVHEAKVYLAGVEQFVYLGRFPFLQFKLQHRVDASQLIGHRQHMLPERRGEPGHPQQPAGL